MLARNWSFHPIPAPVVQTEPLAVLLHLEREPPAQWYRRGDQRVALRFGLAVQFDLGRLEAAQDLFARDIGEPLDDFADVGCLLEDPSLAVADPGHLGAHHRAVDVEALLRPRHSQPMRFC